MITGFTLFWNPGKKVWQWSIRTDQEDGWLVTHISDEEAQRYFRAVEGAGGAGSPEASFRRLCAALAQWSERLSS